MMTFHGHSVERGKSHRAGERPEKRGLRWSSSTSDKKLWELHVPHTGRDGKGTYPSWGHAPKPIIKKEQQRTPTKGQSTKYASVLLETVKVNMTKGNRGARHSQEKPKENDD